MNELRAKYNSKINFYMLIALVAHLPVMLIAAWGFKTSYTQGLVIGSMILIGPVVTYFWDKSSLITSNTMALAGVMMSGLLIHLGKGMIEMHFHIFIFLATLTIYGMVSPIITATLGVVVHHLGFFFLLPESIFNYQASLWIVVIHAVFVVVEDIGLIFIARKFGVFIDCQGEGMKTLKVVSVENFSTSNELSGNAQALASSSQEQAASIAQMSASLKDLKNQVESSSVKIENSVALVENIHSKSNVGTETMNQLDSGVKNISESINSLSDIVNLISQIGDKVTVINDIVFKTQLLSFNASIEAARAGHHGKGFAVVAEEVGQLALSSGEAAKEIESLLSGSQEQVNSIVVQINKKVGDAECTMTEANSQFNEIVSSVVEMNSMVTEVGEANNHNKENLIQFFAALENIEASATQNTSSATQVEALANLTKTQATKLSAIIQDTNKRINLDDEDSQAA
ncbi:MAG: methyl-accepting chemotaxis protein [Bdellovibrionales bacterium]